MLGIFLSTVGLAKPKGADFVKMNERSAIQMLANNPINELEGTLETLCARGKRDTVLFMHFVKQDDGKRVQVYFPENMQTPQSGSRVKIKRAYSLSSTEFYAADVAEVVSKYTSPYNGLGEKKVLVAIINYADKPTNPATFDSYTGIYKTVRDGFLSQSFSNVTINETIMDKVLVPQKSTDACDSAFLYGMVDSIKAEAKVRGLNVADYQHFQMVLPSTNNCGWCGLGSVFGPYTWINACNSYSVVGHELGHNFGMLHSNRFDNCSTNDWKTGCSNIEYGDGASLMGVAEGEFTAVHKAKIKWLDNLPQNPQTQLIKESGVYSIEPLETMSNNVKALKFERAPGEYYFVEFRQPLNYDKKINATYHKSLGIHLLMDNSTAAWRLKTIGVGQSFVDPSFPGKGLTITLLSYDTSGAKVKVDMEVVPPTATPTVPPTKTPTVTPTKTPTVKPTVTPTVPPSVVNFKIVPAQSVYKYDSTKTFWSSVSIWITNSANKPLQGLTANYKVYMQDGKLFRQLDKVTDGSGFAKYGLPIDKYSTPGKYKIIIKTTVQKINYTSAPAYFEVQK